MHPTIVRDYAHEIIAHRHRRAAEARFARLARTSRHTPDGPTPAPARGLRGRLSTVLPGRS